MPIHSPAVDRRIQRTRKKLRFGFATLLQKEPLSEITVQELTSVSGISRSTFYLHFTDMEDMTNQVRDEILADFRAQCDSFPFSQIHENPEPFLTALIRYLAENLDLCMMLFNQRDQSYFLQEVLSFFYEYFSMRRTKKTAATAKTIQYYYTYVFSGCCGVLKRWHLNGHHETPEELAHIIAQIWLSNRDIF